MCMYATLSMHFNYKYFIFLKACFYPHYRPLAGAGEFEVACSHRHLLSRLLVAGERGPARL
jgi:hypothetical protein